MPSADFIEAQKSNSDPDDSHKSEKSSERRGRGRHPNSIANLKPFPKGVSGNPGGKPRIDLAAVVARSIIENNIEGIYEALGKALLKGNAFVFRELAERGYGKVSQPLTIGADESLATVLASSRQRVAAAAQPPALLAASEIVPEPAAPAPTPSAARKPAVDVKPVPAPAVTKTERIPSELSAEERNRAFFDFTTGRVVKG
jgi:hypothetical protein